MTSMLIESQVLIKDDTTVNGVAPTPTYSTEENTGGTANSRQQTVPTGFGNGGQDYTFGRNASYTPRSDFRLRDTHANDGHPNSQNNDEYAYMPDGPDGIYDGGSGNNESHQSLSRPSRQQYDKFAKRTVLLCNLPEGTTHSDVTDVVRGGMLLDIYLRSHDRTASVSFLEEAAAQDFFRHVKRHDLYLRGKRVREPTRTVAHYIV